MYELDARLLYSSTRSLVEQDLASHVRVQARSGPRDQMSCSARESHVVFTLGKSLDATAIQIDELSKAQNHDIRRVDPAFDLPALRIDIGYLFFYIPLLF